MDYETRPTSRAEVRSYAKLFRALFNLPLTGPIDPLALLDRLGEVLGNVTYEIVEKEELPENIPANCIMTTNGGFIIQIADYVFEGAYENNTGGYKMHILHEIMHPYAYKMGFTPIYSRSVKNKKIPAYKSVEWIVKAMAGEVMMPYEETKGLDEIDLMIGYGVSLDAARKRLTY